MGLSKKLRYGTDYEHDFPPLKRRFGSLMEKNLYVRITGLKIQNDILRDWNPFRTYQIEHPEKQSPIKKEED